MDVDKQFIMQALGHRLRDLRKLRGFTQQELATHSGVSRARIYQTERGKANPSFLTLHALAQALHCDTSTLVCIMPSLPLPAPSSPPKPEPSEPKIVVYTTPLRSLQES